MAFRPSQASKPLDRRPFVDDSAFLPEVIEIFSSGEEEPDAIPFHLDTDLPAFIEVDSAESPEERDSLDFLDSVREVYVPEEANVPDGYGPEESMVGTARLYVPPDSEDEGLLYVPPVSED